MSKPLTLDVWIALAPDDEPVIPITHDGTYVYMRSTGSQGFASPSPEGREKFRALFRAMSTKARALGYRKAGT